MRRYWVSMRSGAIAAGERVDLTYANERGPSFKPDDLMCFGRMTHEDSGLILERLEIGDLAQIAEDRSVPCEAFVQTAVRPFTMDFSKILPGVPVRARVFNPTKATLGPITIKLEGSASR